MRLCAKTRAQLALNRTPNHCTCVIAWHCALVTGPFVPDRALPLNVVFVDARHQGPTPTGWFHVAENLEQTAVILKTKFGNRKAVSPLAGDVRCVEFWQSELKQSRFQLLKRLYLQHLGSFVWNRWWARVSVTRANLTAVLGNQEI